MRAGVGLLFLACIVVLGSACEPPDCGRADCGSCSNACCKVSFIFKSTTTEAARDALAKALQAGGPDGRYTLPVTAEGSIGFADLRSYKVGVDFIGQAIHTTATMHYNDTVNWTVYGRGNDTEVIGFSISQIAGAYCDAGQNYKNIVQVVKALGRPYAEQALLGCPAPTGRA